MQPLVQHLACEDAAPGFRPPAIIGILSQIVIIAAVKFTEGCDGAFAPYVFSVRPIDLLMVRVGASSPGP